MSFLILYIFCAIYFHNSSRMNRLPQNTGLGFNANLVLLFLFGLLLNIPDTPAQAIVNMPLNTGPVTFTLTPPVNSFFNFFDDAGASSSYSNNSGITSVVTFAPSTTTKRIKVNFTSFHTEADFDALYIYGFHIILLSR